MDKPFRLAPYLAAALVAAIAAGCVIDVGDQACTPQSDVTDKDDRCPYGSQGGPKVKVEGCVLPPLISGAQCTSTWADVYAIFDDPVRGNCTSGGCHGAEPGAANLYIPSQNSAVALANLRAYSTTRGPYLDITNSTTWILCNIKGEKSGGSPMPKPSGLQTQTDIDIVTNWVLCGAQAPAP